MDLISDQVNSYPTPEAQQQPYMTNKIVNNCKEKENETIKIKKIDRKTQKSLSKQNQSRIVNYDTRKDRDRRKIVENTGSSKNSTT